MEFYSVSKQESREAHAGLAKANRGFERRSASPVVGLARREYVHRAIPQFPLCLASGGASTLASPHVETGMASRSDDRIGDGMSERRGFVIQNGTYPTGNLLLY